MPSAAPAWPFRGAAGLPRLPARGAPAGRGLARLFGLEPAAGRTLAYGFGTRNSFVVLPFALALPAGWEASALVIVLQSLVELLGMLLYLRGLPR
jgi:ACR3 family arsenite efflux pump ArsB